MSLQDGVIYMGKPPPGKTSNAADPPSLELVSIVIFSILIGLNVLFVICRLFSKATAGFSLDDFTKYARHSWDVPLSWLDSSYIKRYAYAQTMVAYPSILFAKISILLLYLRIFTVKKEIRYLIYGGIAWTIVTYGPFIVTINWYCAPHIGEDWGLKSLLRCSKFADWQIFATVMGVILDLFILILPMPLLRRLHLSRNKKVGLIFVFGTASFLVENHVAIIVACVPGAASFFKRYIAPSRISTFLASSFRSIVERRGVGVSNSASVTPKWPHSPLPPSSKGSKSPKGSWNGANIGLVSIGGTPYDDVGIGAMGGRNQEHFGGLRGYKELVDGKGVGNGRDMGRVLNGFAVDRRSGE
ncbi:hypothetical protein HYFRA_00007888 [Hymenoscyphus fraxineus]|uniref:Rhodopsin domain-containing protein n=1 Tax=Hymenoscyphus fraxineus TaxID=746836 RepID=A0A9N9PEX1_9HELO|nr:hypothetical protein HYFRA_00007888 [Hymenoscyphus fraxineus]